MLELIRAIVLFLVGLVFLAKGGDWFVDGATGIARRFRIPEILIGATVVSIGTTIPEVMVSSMAAAEGSGSIAYGNAIGSVICNTALVAAITMAFMPGKIDKKALKLPVAFFFGAAVVYSIVAYCTQYFARWVGIVLLLGFVAYMILAVKQALAMGAAEAALEEAAPAEEKTAAAENDAKDGEKAKEPPLWKDIVLLVIGAALIAVGADLLVDNGTILAEKMGVPSSVIALTFVALGTSLPELITAITALIKGHSDLSLGNVIGANLFNLVLVSGLATTISPFAVPAENTVTIAGNVINSSLVIDIPVMFLVSFIMILPAFIKGRLSRWQGIALLVIYAGFCALQFVL